MSDLLTELKKLDPAAGPLTVQRTSLEQLRDAVLASPRKTSRRWIAPMAAAAAVVIAFGLLWQSGLGEGTVRAVPAASPSATLPTNTWVTTAPSPLSPRHSSVTVWADGTFFVIGGTSSGVCPANADCIAPTYLRDGARYDPVADNWTRIADALDDVIAYPQGQDQETAVLGRTIYLVGRQSVLGYNLDTGQWQKLPLPPGGIVLSFGVSGSSLIAVTSANNGRITFAALEPEQGNWVQRKVHGEWRGSPMSAALVGDRVVLTLGSSLPDSMWVVDTLDLTTGEIGHPAPQRLETFFLGTIGLATSTADYAVWRGLKRMAWFLNPRSGQWSSVDLPKDEGAFVGSSGGGTTYWPVTVSGMVSLRGHLYNPETRLWAVTPAMPTGPDSPLVSSGPDLVLSCFGYSTTTSTFAKDCYLLRPAEASLARP